MFVRRTQQKVLINAYIEPFDLKSGVHDSRTFHVGTSQFVYKQRRLTFFFVVSRFSPHIIRESTIKTFRKSFFSQILEVLRVRQWNSTLRSLPERGNKNIKYFISSSVNGTHNLSHFHPHARVPAPRPFTMMTYFVQI